jgi:hypothetical protein
MMTVPAYRTITIAGGQTSLEHRTAESDAYLIP